MKSRKLISLSDYVFDEHNKMNQIPEQPQVVKSFLNVLNYAKFLSMPLTIGMFVPCDEYGNVLKEPSYYKIWKENGSGFLSQYSVTEVNYCRQYQKALDNVIFEGFIPCIINGVQSVSCSLKSVHYKLLEENTIESIADGTLTLTQSAITKYQI